MEKVDVVPIDALRLINPVPIALVTAVGKDGRANVAPCGPVMGASHDPGLLLITVSPKRHNHKLISESREFVMNIPDKSLLEAVDFCGSCSGRDVDKFKESGLTPLPAKKVKAPIVKECMAHLECKVRDEFTVGDHTVFVGEVVAAYANKDMFTLDEGRLKAGYKAEEHTLIYDISKAKRLLYLGNHYYTWADDKLKPGSLAK
jgi:flavin reductase (DIM6/NTAB) family NADH-FMN oxidoreductase RutF